ncbi:MAG: CoA pyrophosphatase [Deltaproteobacteria bacterium]|nr:CoA pyrophosphatase [Deltaproteobacteria bacterium]MBW2393281.1 CoA pyrophosphatase [Deltaproteobacteria bacterium]
MPGLEQIRAAFSGHEPELIERPTGRRAAVAVVLREHAGQPEVLLIERATKDGDPWSGHMAFPGGRVEAVDASIQIAAERETFEEVGVSLEGAELIGRLDDLQGRHAGRVDALVISGFVFHHPSPGELEPNYEVAETFWFPVRELREPERHIEKAFRETGSLQFPGIVVGDPERHIVWGLTYRFIEIFFEVVGHPLRDRWGELPMIERTP